GLAPLLRGIVSSDDVVEGKPHPEGYLRALELLDGVAPADVLVLEDTEAGIASARAAGMRVVAKSGTLAPQRLAAADERIGVMVELKSPYRYRRHDVVPRTLALLDDEAVVVCFEAGAIRAVRVLRPELRTIQHVALVPMRLAAARRVWAVGFEERRATARA